MSCEFKIIYNLLVSIVIVLIVNFYMALCLYSYVVIYYVANQVLRTDPDSAPTYNYNILYMILYRILFHTQYCRNDLSVVTRPWESNNCYILMLATISIGHKGQLTEL